MKYQPGDHYPDYKKLKPLCSSEKETPLSLGLKPGDLLVFIEKGYGYCGTVFSLLDRCGWENSTTPIIYKGNEERAYYLERLARLPNSSNNLNPFNMSDIKEKFALIFKAEPEKSFRKAGITDGDDLLTEDGQSIFIKWLLDKNGNDFKKEVVDELLKKEKDE